MKYVYVALCLTGSIAFLSCDKDDEPVVDEFEYHAHIHTPNTSAKTLGDTLEIEIEFESHTGMTIHHINTRIYDKSSGTQLYSKPDDAHIHESDGEYTFEDTFILSTLTGVVPNADIVLEAKVWGHDEGVSEVSETIEFHVN